MVNPLRSTTLRIGLMQVGAGVLALILLAAALWWITAHHLDGELNAIIQEDTQTLTALDRESGRDAVVQTIDGRVGAGLDEDEVLLLTNASFTRLAGNLPAWPIDAPMQPGWDVISIVRGGKAGQARVLHSLLPGGEHLLAGQDLTARTTLEMQFRAGLLGAVLMVIATGAIGAWLVRRNFVLRVEQINGTARAIVAGRLNERLPAKDERDELDLLAGTINRMLDQIEQLIDGVRNVSNAIAHDLRTPLAELRIRLEALLLARQVSNDAAAEVEGAIEDIDRLIATFNGLLRLAELDSGARRSGFVRVGVSAIITQAVELYAPVAEAKSIVLTSCSTDVLDVEGDPVLLAQAVANLIDNALKYAPGNTEITVKASLGPDDSLLLSVADQGSGIPSAERSRAADRFFRGRNSAGTQGIGLGLSMVAAITRLHGGELRLEDNHPGLRATLALPPRSPRKRDETRNPAGVRTRSGLHPEAG